MATGTRVCCCCGACDAGVPRAPLPNHPPTHPPSQPACCKHTQCHEKGQRGRANHTHGQGGGLHTGRQDAPRSRRRLVRRERGSRGAVAPQQQGGANDADGREGHGGARHPGGQLETQGGVEAACRHWHGQQVVAKRPHIVEADAAKGDLAAGVNWRGGRGGGSWWRGGRRPAGARAALKKACMQASRQAGVQRAHLSLMPSPTMHTAWRPPSCSRLTCSALPAGSTSAATWVRPSWAAIARAVIQLSPLCVHVGARGGGYAWV